MENLGKPLTPIFIDKLGPAYSNDDVEKLIYGMILSNDYFYRMAKKMTTDTEKAIQKTDEVTDGFGKSLSKFFAMQTQITEASKKASGNIRDATEKLSQGLLKIEKTANFDRLERYVVLLERASVAIESLAELEKNGRLEKIANAIK